MNRCSAVFQLSTALGRVDSTRPRETLHLWENAPAFCSSRLRRRLECCTENVSKWMPFGGSCGNCLIDGYWQAYFLKQSFWMGVNKQHRVPCFKFRWISAVSENLYKIRNKIADICTSQTKILATSTEQCSGVSTLFGGTVRCKKGIQMCGATFVLMMEGEHPRRNVKRNWRHLGEANKQSHSNEAAVGSNVVRVRFSVTTPIWVKSFWSNVLREYICWQSA